MAKTKSEQGRFAYQGLDRVIHEKARLSVLTSLVAYPKGLVFGDLKQMCGLTDGNLSRHLQVLQEAALVAIEKGYDHNRPQTVIRITPEAGTVKTDEARDVVLHPHLIELGFPEFVAQCFVEAGFTEGAGAVFFRPDVQTPAALGRDWLYGVLVGFITDKNEYVVPGEDEFHNDATYKEIFLDEEQQ